MKGKALANEYRVRNRKTPMGNLRHKISNSIFKKIKNKNGKSCLKMLDYSLQDLKDHLERSFSEGMSWESFINGDIHIDHIIPHQAFYYESEKDEGFKLCWSLSNLNSSWSMENYKKSDKLPNGDSARNLPLEHKIHSKNQFNKLLDSVNYNYVFDIYNDVN